MDDASRLIEMLHAELLPALGCTEPIAVALAAAKARSVLGCEPSSVSIIVSSNIFKNARAVTIPHSGGRHGIPMAAALGVVAGDPEAGLECLAGVTDRDIEAAADWAERVELTVAEDRTGLYVRADVAAPEAACGSDAGSASAELIDDHTRFASVSRDGQELASAHTSADSAHAVDEPTSALTSVLDLARTIDLTAHPRLVDLLETQIAYNSRVADEGLRTPYGAQVGRALAVVTGPQRPARLEARVRAAAAADARMGGCSLPVVINSGSGNQGLTVSLPVITYAEELGRSRDELHRALLVANLLALMQKKQIGTSLVTTAGMVCDGAKASCAAKISVAVEGGLTAVDLVEADHGFAPGAGLLGDTPDATVSNIGRLAAEGMRGTDEVIVDVLRRDDGV